MLQDPNFDRTVVLMCVHNDEGAMGLVINRAAPLTMRDIVLQMGMECSVEVSQDALVGGPVALDSGLLLYEAGVDETREDELRVTEELCLCPNRDLLSDIGKGLGPQKYHMFLGHSGWGPGQLEQEISQGAWIPAHMRMELIFSVPLDDRWDDALRGEGLHPGQLGSFRPQA